MTEEAPIMPAADAKDALTTSRDENARKGNFMEFGAFLTAAEEVPAVMSPGSGSANFKVVENGNPIRFELRVANTAGIIFARLHQNVIGENGPVVYILRGDKVEGSLFGVYAKGTITALMLSGPLLGGDLIILRVAMRTGNAYVNVYPDQAPGGELRGNF